MADVSKATLSPAEEDRTGVIYISSLPRGISPPTVKHILSNYGQVERIFLKRESEQALLARARAKYGTTKGGRAKRLLPNYVEGWVEFKEKAVAKTVAAMLNAQPVPRPQGVGKSETKNRFRDCVWTMKYLPRVKWRHLTEQITHEQQSRNVRLRQEISAGRRETKEYLRAVEHAKIQETKRKRKEAANEATGKGSKGSGKADAIIESDAPNGQTRERKGLSGADKPRRSDLKVQPNEKLSKVLSSIFN